MDSWGLFFCNLINRFKLILPSTPADYRLSALSTQLADNIPFVGAGLVYEIFQDMAFVLTFVLAIKLFAHLPGKF